MFLSVLSICLEIHFLSGHVLGGDVILFAPFGPDYCAEVWEGARRNIRRKRLVLFKTGQNDV